mmetsp:Transcript_27512/g.29676  ORF Transcript_27512/g.29676 Transcript_27512/m.29676 type:complete len:91 (-) Transcript_27512:1362-1634(-)
MKKEDKIQVSIIQKEEGKDITQIHRPNSQSVDDDDDDDDSRVAWHGMAWPTSGCTCTSTHTHRHCEMELELETIGTVLSPMPACIMRQRS